MSDSDRIDEARRIMAPAVEKAWVSQRELDSLLTMEDARARLEEAHARLGLSAERAAESMRAFCRACDAMHDAE